MFDVGWSELLVVIAVAVLVIGPNDIPKVMQALGKLFRRAQYMRFALSQQFEDMMKDTDLTELRQVNQLRAVDQPETDEAAADEEEGEDAARKASSTDTRH